jgi:sugar lactone lactonase YvrE
LWLWGSAAWLVAAPVVNASCGFNSSDYQLGQPLSGQGQNDPGWGGSTWGTWYGNGSSGSTQYVTAYRDSAAQEGDGDMHLIGSSPNNEVGAIRYWGTQLTTPFWIDQYVRLTNGTASFISRSGTGGDGDSTAANWGVANGHFTARDGDGSGGGAFLDTGFAVKPMQWQEVATLVDPATMTYEFYVDGQKYNPPHPLHFRANVAYVNEVNYLAQQEAWVDNVRVYSTPEPSTLALLAAGALGLLGYAWHRRRAGGGLRSTCFGITALVVFGLSTWLPGHAAAGVLYVSDESGEVYKYAADGSRSTFASGLNTPAGLAVDRSGDLFVAEWNTGNIYEFTPAGVRSTFASGLGVPGYLTLDMAGDLFATDLGTGNIYKFTPTGARSTFASGLSNPSGLAFDAKGNLYEADWFSGNIYEFAPNGSRTIFSNSLSRPMGLACDAAGDLFATDTATGGLYKFTSGGGLSTLATGLSWPCGLAFDQTGNLFLASGMKVYEITPDGSQSVFADGLGSSFGVAAAPPPDPPP